MRNAIIRANKPIASVSAKPKIVNPNNCCLKDYYVNRSKVSIQFCSINVTNESDFQLLL